MESSAELLKNTVIAIKDWHLGPENVDQPNNEYWAKSAEMWGVSVEEARRKLCVNCEYYDNLPTTLKELEAIPMNKFDLYNSNGQRGYCHKLHIVCHTTRSCQAWECKEYEVPEEEVKEVAKDHAAIMFGSEKE
jgi:hypothetical protein